MTHPANLKGPRLVALVVYPGVQMLDMIGPFEIFSAANELLRHANPGRNPFYATEIVSRSGKPVAASNGLGIEAGRSVRWNPSVLDTLVVPGALEVERALADDRLIQWVRKTAPKARRIVSVCSGTFLLAAAGLLEGRRATTHWAGCEQLKKLYPGIEVDPDPIFLRDGQIYTSAGVTAGMDLALALVEEDLGRDVALEIARWFVMYLKRPGGQSQFSIPLKAQVSGMPALQKLLKWISENPSSNLEVEVLAARLNMSPRHFARVFHKEIGVTPAAHVAESRLESARRELEESRDELKIVAMRSGFGSEESLRRVFQKRLGVTPGEYRKRFQRPFPEGVGKANGAETRLVKASLSKNGAVRNGILQSEVVKKEAVGNEVVKQVAAKGRKNANR
ncbi:MAG TPA: GlxA family transcriptional regulator [Candidatus Angelobacter sp.]|nr:GlxA family transcriptional regulator [Candidatus Angelobacter sp.]